MSTTRNVVYYSGAPIICLYGKNRAPLRKNITLTKLQLDRCTVDPLFQIRAACVKRPDCQLNQTRFEAILFDKNPNILSTFTNKTSPALTSLDKFVWVVLKESPPEIQVALAVNKWLLLSDEQINFGSNSSNAAVRAAFCRRQKKACNPEESVS